MAVAHRSTHFLSTQQSPQERDWIAVCDAAKTVYRGFIKPHITESGEKLETVVLFHDKRGLVTGLGASEFQLKNVCKRMKERDPRRAVGRPSPMRTRAITPRALAVGVSE